MATAFRERATEAAMTRVVGLAAAVVDAAAFASVSMRGGDDGLHTPWASDEAARGLDQLQYDAGDGPCVEAVRSEEVCQAVLTDTGGPSTDFAAAAARHGVGSVLSTPLRVEGVVLGALNLYYRGDGPFADGQRRLAADLTELLATVLSLAGPSFEVRLAQAVATRDVIAAASGVLMAWHRCGQDEAFAILRRTAVRDDRSIVEVARDVLTAPSPDSL